MKKEITRKERVFYTTIEKNNRVYTYQGDDIVAKILWVANIQKICVQTDKSISYLLTYDKSEVGIKIDEFWTPNWKVTHQRDMGRFKHDSGQ